jgi:hypothetical protein
MIRECLVKKKPMTLKAVQFTSELTDQEIRTWSNNKAFISQLDRDDEPCVLINTLEGPMKATYMKATYGDWIMQGATGNDYYPIREDIMILSYDFLRD